MDPFMHFLDQRVVVYSECKYAVLLDSINAHLRGDSKHRRLQEAIKGLIMDITELY
jgi:hypothetical protein